MGGQKHIMYYYYFLNKKTTWALVGEFALSIVVNTALLDHLWQHQNNYGSDHSLLAEHNFCVLVVDVVELSALNVCSPETVGKTVSSLLRKL